MIWVRRRAALLSPTVHGQVKLVRFGVPAARLSRWQERYDRQEHRRLAAIERLAARSGPAKTDRSGSARATRHERDAKQRAAAARPARRCRRSSNGAVGARAYPAYVRCPATSDE